MSARARMSSAVVYVDAVAGSDANDGLTEATALRTLQVALDVAHGNFDCAPPWTWTGSYTNVGYRSPGVTVQMAPAPAAMPYVLPQPLYLDGASPAGPITLRGDPNNALAYNIYGANPLQGLTAQNGAHLICDGFTIRGAPNCTSINGLANGKIAIKNVWFGGVADGRCCPIGAAGGSQVDILGHVRLIGAGFVAVMSAIEDGRIMLCSGHQIELNNAMDFGIMVNMVHASCWTQGVAPNFTGHTTDSTGAKLKAFWGAFIGFDHNLIPGSYDPSADKDSLSVVL